MNTQYHSEQLIRIDNLIRTILIGKASNQQIKEAIILVSPDLEFNLSEDLEYAATIQIYSEVLDLLKHKYGISSNSMDLNSMDIAHFICYVLNQFQRIDLEDDRFARQELRNRESLEIYLRQLLKHYARLLFVRVDFAIQQQYQSEIDIKQFHSLMKKMSNRYSNRDGCFSGLQGFAWAIEQGETKGFHCHVLLIYDGSKHQNDFGIGLAVSQYWHQLTEGRGSCFISNAPDYKAQFEEQGRLGIGMIHRCQPLQVENAIKSAIYLVNPEKKYQNLRVRVPRMRTFNHGSFNVHWRRGKVGQSIKVCNLELI
ncbi:inovirus-type Gp2 protein [Acinetobacter chinensis]|uniref:Inovirus-type Gp2 protein n=1 Tax=Acinetobacter chinensis TaxID=2004650 RepID=A0ABU3WBX4_9GAMM|nr:inovirus-type Gp2 protein [Acinetobacter chinensis]MDV2467812.1 inovirus-type Gp2 protein [Acinetobacter chinensis]